MDASKNGQWAWQSETRITDYMENVQCRQSTYILDR